MRDIEREPFETSGCADGVFEAQSAPQESVLSPPRHRALYPGSHMGKSGSKFKQSRRPDFPVFRFYRQEPACTKLQVPFCLASAMIWYVSSKTGSDASDG